MPKCSTLSFSKGVVDDEASLHLYGLPLRRIGVDEHEEYLGTPIGSKFLFRLPRTLPRKLNLLASSLLAPWQKLEVFRSHLLPSLSHYLASGRVRKTPVRDEDDPDSGLSLYELNQRCLDFLRLITATPLTATNEFFFADRRAGGLGANQLVDECDVWTIARAAQLLDSVDPVVSAVARGQIESAIRGALKQDTPDVIPYSEYLSGSKDGGMYGVRFNNQGLSLWSRTRKAAAHCRIRIETSGESPTLTRIIADDISVSSNKGVRGLRAIFRGRHTTRLLICPHQGRAAAGLMLDQKTNDTARLLSTRTQLSFLDWEFIHQARLSLLPLRGLPGHDLPDKSCRRCPGELLETTAHVLNHCPAGRGMFIRRHDAVLEVLVSAISRLGLPARVNLQDQESGLRPDIVIEGRVPRLIIDVAVAHDDPTNLQKAFDSKVSKYEHLGLILPLVVGSLGSWLPTNDEIAAELRIGPRAWAGLRRTARLLAIKGSTSVIRHHFDPTGSAPTDQQIVMDG